MSKVMHLEAQPFGDSHYRMAIGPDEIFELETGMSRNGRLPELGQKPMPIFELFANIMSGRVETEDGSIGNPFRSGASQASICNVVRLGLIGGGECTPPEASDLIKRFGPPNRPLKELWDIAAAVLYAALVGIDENADA
ncbi:hypothetical protein BV96_01781 [Sphingomonas paucimobilis]|nr:hypothetical protein BV96_01781 [Sphingomonas paucimobilis]